MLDPGDFAEFVEVETRWSAVRAEWHTYLDGLSEVDLPEIVDYRNTRGNGFSLPLQDVLQHVVNHATEHRSQITPLLYRAGARTEPLDYMRMRLRAQTE